MQKKIFISHAKTDEIIGEKLLDTLISLGIPQDQVFYSSKYHTGVGFGEDFHSEVKAALKSCETVVFLLTPNFYESEYCLNEMGAAWYADKKMIPILLGGLLPNNMRGFIDSHYIAFTPAMGQAHMLVDAFSGYIGTSTEFGNDAANAFAEFVSAAERLAEQVEAQKENQKDSESTAEKLILNGKFTDTEIIFLNYFIECETQYLDDSQHFDSSVGGFVYSDEFDEFSEYCAQFDKFDYKKAKRSLSNGKYIELNYESGYYVGCELNDAFFRDLISLSSRAKEYFNSVIDRRNVKRSSESALDKIILDPRFEEIAALLLYYLLDTKVEVLGDRWMADGTKLSIKEWEAKNNIASHKLSAYYSDALWSLIRRNMLIPTQFTSYGNPRQYALKDEYDKALFTLSQKSKSVLEDAFHRNQNSDKN